MKIILFNSNLLYWNQKYVACSSSLLRKKWMCNKTYAYDAIMNLQRWRLRIICKNVNIYTVKNFCHNLLLIISLNIQNEKIVLIVLIFIKVINIYRDNGMIFPRKI